MVGRSTLWYIVLWFSLPEIASINADMTRTSGINDVRSTFTDNSRAPLVVLSAPPIN